MTLREMREAYPERFYKQDWFEGEAFMDKEPSPDIPRLPILVEANPNLRPPSLTAADLAWLWLQGFDAPVWGEGEIWSHYIWTSDVDSHGQRVYVGNNGRGLEIHRHLHLTDRWVVPV